MKATQAIEQLYKTLPFLTDKFSQSVNIGEIAFSGTVATVTTDSVHGLEVNDTCTILDLYAPIEILSISRIDTILKVVTAIENDITFGDQKTVTMSGANESEFNGEFNILSVESSTEFTLSTVDSGAISATGNLILQQTTGYIYNGIVGYKTVASVVDANAFTYNVVTPSAVSVFNTGAVAVGFRITGAVSFESALAMYTANSSEDYWAFVIIGSNTASKDRKNNSDAVYVISGDSGFRQELNQSFSVVVFATASGEADAYNIKDDMQDVGGHLIKSLVGVKFDNGFEAKDNYGNVFDTHFIQFYDKGIYAHNFIFQTTTQIRDGDINQSDNDVAFNSIGIEMNIIVKDMEVKMNTIPMTAIVNLRTNNEES